MKVNFACILVLGLDKIYGYPNYLDIIGMRKWYQHKRPILDLKVGFIKHKKYIQVQEKITETKLQRMW